jgi:hypothetical protein
MNQHNQNNQLVKVKEEGEAEEVGRDLMKTIMKRKNKIFLQELRTLVSKKLLRVPHLNLFSNN